MYTASLWTGAYMLDNWEVFLIVLAVGLTSAWFLVSGSSYLADN